MKSLASASKVKSLALAMKPASSRKCPVLGSRNALFFNVLKMGQSHDQFCLVLKNTIELAKKILKTFFPEECLNFPENFQNFGAKIFFFSFGECLNFPENLRIFGAKTFFFLRSQPRCVDRPWFRPRALLSLALSGSVLRRAALGLGFFCVLGLEPCVLDSTSGKLQVYLLLL